MNEQEIKKLYQALIGKGYSTQDLGDEQRFLHMMSDSTNRKQLYDWVSSKGNFRIGDYDTYESRLTGKPIGGASTQATTQPAAQPKPGYVFTDEELEAGDAAGAGAGQVQPAASKPATSKPVSQGKPAQPAVSPIPTIAEMMDERAEKLGTNTAYIPATTGKKPQLTTGMPWQNVEYTPEEEAQIEEGRRQKSLDDQIASAEADIEAINERIDKLGYHNITRYGAGFGAPMSAGETATGKKKDQLLAAKRQAEERLHTLKESRDKNTSGFWRNVTDVVTDPSTWSFGLIPISDEITKTGLASKIESGEELSTRQIKAVLRDLIEAEDKHHPLSDDALREQLTEKGFPIARRTVAKYREALGIPIARLRKE